MQSSNKEIAVAASDDIKSLALEGRFSEIHSKYGAKREAKALAYAYQKLQHLTEKQSSGADVEKDKYATPFLLMICKTSSAAKDEELKQFGDAYNKATSVEDEEEEKRETAALLPTKLILESETVLKDTATTTVDTITGATASLVSTTETPTACNSVDSDNAAAKTVANGNDAAAAAAAGSAWSATTTAKDEELTDVDVNEEQVTDAEEEPSGGSKLLSIVVNPGSSTLKVVQAEAEEPEELMENEAVLIKPSLLSRQPKPFIVARATAAAFNPPTATVKTKHHSSSSSSSTSKSNSRNNDESTKKKNREQKTDGGGRKVGAPPFKRNSDGTTGTTRRSKAGGEGAKRDAVVANFKKDPNAPKGAKGSYMFFGDSVRIAIKSDNPDFGVTDIAKETGKRWKGMNEQQKAPFVEMATDDKNRHKQQLELYLRNNPSAAGNMTVAQKKKKAVSAAAAAEAVSKNKSKSRSKGKSSNVSKKRKKHRKRSSADSSNNSGSSSSESARKTTDSDTDDDSYYNDGSGTNVAKSRKKSCSSSSSLAKQAREGGFSFTAEDLFIKQDSLPAEIDLLHTDFVEREKCDFPPDVVLNVGMKVALVLEPYRCFLSELPQTAVEKCSFETVCNLKKRVIFGTIEEIADAPSSWCTKTTPAASATPTTTTSATAAATAAAIDLPAVEVEEGSLAATTSFTFSMNSSSSISSGYSVLHLLIHGQTYQVLYAPFSSALLTSDQFILDYDNTYKQSMNSVKTELLQVNTQVRKMFAVDANNDDLAADNNEEDRSAPLTSAIAGGAELHEGSIYHINEDISSNPYKSIHVVWLQQEKSSNDWFYSYQQSDNLVSPWELQVSAFQPQSATAIKQSASRAAVNIPKSLLVGKFYSKAILAHIKTWDASTPFKERLSKCSDPEYRRLFPNKEDRLDLSVITSLCTKGRYDDENNDSSSSSSGSSSICGAGIGITMLFDDLERMVRNSKTFNASNQMFLPWRQADILEKALHRLKSAMADAHNIELLQSSIENVKKQAAASQMATMGECV